MKVLAAVFAVLILVLQYQIWFGGSNSAQNREQLRLKIAEQEQQNKLLKQQNEELRQEIQTLRKDPALLEEIAREQLGLIKPNETFYRIIPKESDR